MNSVREQKKGRQQKVQFSSLATDGTAVDDEDDTKDSRQSPNTEQVFIVKLLLFNGIP